MRTRLGKFFAVLLGILTGIVGLVSLISAGLLIADGAAERTARVVPSYAKIDLEELIAKEEWTDEDYDTVYRQTGLKRSGADSVPREMLPLFQEAFFFEGERRHDPAASTTPHDYLIDEEGYEFLAPIVPLEEGDVLVTSSCHTYGWRNGHAALVVDAEPGLEKLLQSITLGEESVVSSRRGGYEWFQSATNFMVLRLKDVPKEERAALAEDAARRLVGIPYSVFVGFFSPKDQFGKDCDNSERKTHCSHLVWQAFCNAGYDIDCNGGPLVTAHDIARSPLFEVVQVYGFDPDKLW